MHTLFQSILNISDKYRQNRSLQFRATPFQSWCILSETQCRSIITFCNVCCCLVGCVSITLYIQNDCIVLIMMKFIRHTGDRHQFIS